MAAIAHTQAGILLDSKFSILLCVKRGANVKSDPTYPDPYSGGYKGAKKCGGFAPTAVISISYGGPEAVYPAAYMDRQCSE
jgi:tripeptidyl-peptidase-1